MQTVTNISKGALWTGRVLKIILVLFLLLDSITKIIHESHTVQSSAQLGIAETGLSFLGFYLLVSTICFAIPKTAVMGGLLLTAYLGGAAAVTYIAKVPGHPYLFPVVFCILIWISIWLQNKSIKNCLPLTKA